MQPGLKCRLIHAPHSTYEEMYYVLEGRGYLESDGERFNLDAGDAAYNRENSRHRVFNTDQAKTLRLLAVGGIMLVGLLPQWPTESPYEILEHA